MNSPESAFAREYALVVMHVIAAGPATHTLEEAARLAGIHPDMLRYYCRRGLFGDARAAPETEPLFDDDALYELRRFEHYRRHHGVNRQTLRLLCDLWQKIDRLQAEVRALRG